MPFPYKNPISPIQVLGPQSVNRTVVFGTHFSTNGTGGFMEVFSLSGLTYEIPVGQTGSIEYSGNTIPINFIKGTGAVYSPDVLILNSDNVSSGRRKLGMLAYVYELDQVYQYDIPNYEQLWTAATASTNCVFINEFGTTVRNNTIQGQAFINAWTASTIEGVNGVVRANARWKKYWGNNLSVTGGSFNGVTSTLTLVNITGGTVDITGFGGGGGGGASFTAGTYTQSNLNLTLTSSAGTLTVTGVTGLYISGGSYSSGNTTLTLSNSTGGTLTITGFSQTFSGGSGNCINQLYLNEIYPCTSDIKIQPLSTGRVYFGNNSGASGVTIDFNTETTQKSARLGLNTNNPSYTFEFRSYDRTNALFYRDKLGSPFEDWKQIAMSASTDLVPMYTVFQADNNGVLGRHGISIGSKGYGVANTSLNNTLGKTGDTFIQAFSNTNGINIINGPGEVGAGTEDYIRFYAGQTAEDGNTPDIHIQGSGATRGFVGVNITNVTNTLHVSATTNPVRFEGLVSSANTRFLVANSDGVVTYTTSSPGGGGGDSITGGTFNQNNLNLQLVSTASTVTITGVTGLYISAGTYSSSTTTLLLSNSTGGTISITGFSQTFSGGSGNCINQLYLNEIYPCTSDIKIQPLSAGKVFFGSLSGASGITIDLVSDTGYTTTRLGLNNSLPDYTIDFYSRDRKNRLYLLDNLTNIYSASDDAAYGPGQPPRMIIVTTTGIDSSLAGTPITVYNSAGDSVTKILNGVITPSPSAGFSRLNFLGSNWSEDYRQSAGGYFVFPLSSGIGDSEIKNLIFSGKSDTNSSFSVTGPNRSELQGFHGISIGIRGYTTSGTALNNKVGVTGDSFIQVFPGTNGLNIINEVGTDTDDYIRFYAGRNFINNTPDIHIQGSGATRGYVGINITGVTNQLHVSATTNPLRLEGLVESANTRYLVANSDGVITYTTGTTGGSSSGFTTISITGTPQFSSTTNQTINFSGINITITSAATNTLVFSAGTGGGGGISGSGTTNYIPKWTGSTGLGNSQLQDDGSQIYTDQGYGSPLTGNLSINASGTTGIAGRATQYGIYGALSGLTADAAGVYGQATIGQYGVYGLNQGILPGTYVGVYGVAQESGDAFEGAIFIGGRFKGDPVTNAGYSLWLEDGTEGVGKVLVSQTSDGKANWNTFSGINISITSAATNTLVFSAATGGGSGGFSAVSINNNVQFNSSSFQTINFSGINISITSGISANTLIFSAATGLAGTGTTNYVAKWTGTTALTDSLIYDDGSIVVVSGTSATVPGSKFSVTGPIAAQGVQLSSKSGSIALVTSNYASWGTGVSQIAIGDVTPLASSTGAHNIAIGSAAIKNAVTPSGNTAIGTESLNILNNGNYNVAIGYQAAMSIDQTDEAVYIGYQAGMNGSTAGNNVVIGSQAGLIYSGVNSVVIGKNAFRDSTFGNGNVAIGVSAGRENYGGGNVFIGFGAGYYNNGNNRLYIQNSVSNLPLIYGEFDNLRLGIATTAVTNTLHVSATTHPLRLEGLVSSANTRFLVANSDGVVTYTTSAPGGGSGFTSVSINDTGQFSADTNQNINFSGINITITSAATNTLVFSAGTGGSGGVTSLTTGSGLSANSTTGAITIVATATTSFGVAVDGSGGVITTGQKGYVRIPYGFTITSWTLIGSPSGSITFDIWRTNGAIPTVANTIIGGGGTKPNLSSGTYATSSTLTNWTITGATGDVIGWNVDSCTTTTIATLQLFVTRTQ